MERIISKTNFALALAVAGMLAAGPAVAAKPSWAGEGKGGKSEHGEKPASRQGGQPDRDDGTSRGSGRSESGSRVHFADEHRTHAHEYYREEFRHGRCPPGLAKKDNGCMPPGLAKKWAVGQPIPRDVIFHNVPPALVSQFGQPPAGHRYVRVADDILLIGPGPGMVIDAMRGLGRMN